MSLTFGGPDLQDIYVVTTDNLRNPNRHGTVFKARTEVPGLPSPKSRFA
jgi:sugar lactone lactonase YvrE